MGKKYLYKAVSFSFLLIIGLVVVQGIVSVSILTIYDWTNSQFTINLEFISVIAWFGMIYTFLLSFVFVAGDKNVKWSEFGLRRTVMRDYKGMFLSMLVVVVFFLVYLFVLSLNGYTQFDIDRPHKLLLLFLFALFSSLSEEIPIRGYLLNLFLKENKKLPGVIFTSVLFSIMHLLNPKINFISIFNLFLVGCFLSLVTIYTGKVYFAVSIHFFFNFFEALLGFNLLIGDNSFSMLSLGRELSGGIIEGGYNGLTGSVILTGLLFISIVAVLMLLKKQHVRLKGPGQACPLSPAQKHNK